MHIILHFNHRWAGYGIVLLLPILRQLASHSRKTRQTQTCAFLQATRENGETIPHPTKSFRYEKNPPAQWGVLLLLVCCHTWRIPVTAACREADKRVKVWDNRANPWKTTNSLVPPQVPKGRWARPGCHTASSLRVWQGAGPCNSPWAWAGRKWQQSSAPWAEGRGRSDLPQGAPRRDLTSVDSEENNWLIVINTRIYLAFLCQLPPHERYISIPKGRGITESPSPAEHRNSPSKLGN